MSWYCKYANFDGQTMWNPNFGFGECSQARLLFEALGGPQETPALGRMAQLNLEPQGWNGKGWVVPGRWCPKESLGNLLMVDTSVIIYSQLGLPTSKWAQALVCLHVQDLVYQWDNMVYFIFFFIKYIGYGKGLFPKARCMELCRIK